MAIATTATLRVSDAASTRDWRPAAVLRSAGWLTLAQVTLGGGTFVVSMIRARSLSLEEFGTFALASAFVAFLSVFADFGLSVMMLRDLSLERTDARGYLSRAMTLTLATSVGAAAAVLLAGVVFARGGALVALSAVLALNLVLTGLSLAPLAYLRANGRGSVEAVTRLLSGAILVALTALFAFTGADVMAYGWAVVFSSVVSLVIPAWFAVGALGALAPRADLSFARQLLSESVPIGIAQLCTGVYYYADSIILGALGRSEGLARYNAAYAFVFGCTVVITALRTAFVPAQARGLAGEAPLKPALRLYLRVSVSLGLFAAIMGMVAATPLLSVVYGETYVSAAHALRVLLVTAGVMFASSYFGSNLLLSGRRGAYLAATAIGAVVNVALNLALIPRFGIEGAAYSTLASEVVVCVAVARGTRLRGARSAE